MGVAAADTVMATTDVSSGASEKAEAHERRPRSLSTTDADTWVTLAARCAQAGDDGVPSVRRPVLQVAMIGIVLAALVAGVSAPVVRRLSEQQAVHDVAELTDVLARSVVQPALTNDSATDPAAATRALGMVVHTEVVSHSVIRVKLWTPTGKIMYSDEPRLVGRTFPLDDEAQAALRDHRVEADVSDLSRPENRFEQGEGKLLEVYRPVWTPDGHQLLLESYFKYSLVNEQSGSLWRGFAGILISAVLAVLVLLLPVLAYLFRRIHRAHDQQQRLARRALDASDEERRRIGASLHDGVVQQLVGASFDIAGQAERAAAAGAGEHAGELRAAGAAVRGSIGGLRALLVEIYPPSIGAAGLAAALRDLGATASDLRIVADVDEDAAARLPAGAQEEIFRVAQETARNAVKHSSAKTMTFRLTGGDDTTVVFEIVDDGTGFDAARAYADAEEGHIGLRLLSDAARRCGAGLLLASRPGRGTRYRMEVPVS